MIKYTHIKVTGIKNSETKHVKSMLVIHVAHPLAYLRHLAGTELVLP